MGLPAMLKSQVSKILNNVIRDKPVFEVFGIGIPIPFFIAFLLFMVEFCYAIPRIFVEKN